MGTEKKQWYQSKTVWTGIVGGVTAIGSFFTGEMTWQTMLPTLVISVSAIFMRTGIENTKK
jgi:hypothetical protein